MSPLASLRTIPAVYRAARFMHRSRWRALREALAFVFAWRYRP